MVSNDVANYGVLALQADPKPMHALLEVLRQVGLQVDVVGDLHAARTSFFSSGGHDCLIIAPDVAPAIATSVTNALRCVDPELAMATFGPGGSSGPRARTAKLSGYHPGSRAGQGALIRFLHNL